MNFTIFYEQEGYRIDLPKLMGRNAAGASFLQGLFRHASSPQFSCLTGNESGGNTFRELIPSLRTDGASETILMPRLRELSKTGGLFYPGPSIAQSAFQRVSASNIADSWCISGITHTTSSAGAMDAIANWITSPVQPWDAVICTSTAVKKNVEVVLQAEVDSLRERLGITKIVLPKLPVIPLGVHTQDFSYTHQQRAKARAALNTGDDTLVVLYTGRLSFHAKAHPLAMYQALENAAQATGKEVVLVECGWHANEYIEQAFAAGAQMASPSVRVVTLDGRIAENRETAWASADVFCSLSDNIQETFGIVPIEAMAAGLPVVVSDWDGYKDTVRDGIDGFRIPTIAPAPGLAGDLAHRHALEIDTYDMYCGHSSSLVAVHAQKLTNAFIELFQSPELRKRMGEAGRLRATQDYDWRTIIPRYEELWDEQTTIRLAAIKAREEGAKKSGKPLAPSVWPARLDPTIGFANYPTQHLTLTTELTLTEPSATKALEKLAEYKELAMVNYAHYVFPTDEEIKAVFEAAETSLPNASTAEALLAGIEAKRRPYVLRGLAWLCKLGLLQFS
ncbi:glycosyltransferase family 4 protein [Gammaproteobacteria bacterium]|nr:glycosyltransferase family 4 protein [Gammaproteobacteria bacterium]